MRFPIGGGANRRASLVVIDQVLSSGSNLVVLIWVAHALAPIDFGRFSLVFFVYAFSQEGLRALVAVPVLVHPEDADLKNRDVVGAGMLLSLIVAVLCVLVGVALWLAADPLGLPFIIVGGLMPLLMVEDVGRFLAIAQSRPRRAIGLDALWILLFVVAFAAVTIMHGTSLSWFMASWAGSGAVAGLWVFVQHGLPSGPRASIGWLKSRWDFSWRSLVASTSAATAALFGSALVAFVSSPLAVAAIRAALLLERPATMIQQAVATSAATDIARESSDNAGLLRHQRRALLISLAVAAANLVVLVFLPDALGRAVLGGVWPLVQPLALIIGLHVVAIAAQSGVRAALFGRREIRTMMRVDIAGSVIIIIALVVGAALGDSRGALWGAVVGQAVTSAIWWVMLLRNLRKNSHLEQPAGPHEAGAEAMVTLPRGGDPRGHGAARPQVDPLPVTATGERTDEG